MFTVGWFLKDALQPTAATLFRYSANSLFLQMYKKASTCSKQTHNPRLSRSQTRADWHIPRDNLLSACVPTNLFSKVIFGDFIKTHSCVATINGWRFLSERGFEKTQTFWQPLSSCRRKLPDKFLVSGWMQAMHVFSQCRLAFSTTKLRIWWLNHVFPLWAIKYFLSGSLDWSVELKGASSVVVEEFWMFGAHDFPMQTDERLSGNTLLNILIPFGCCHWWKEVLFSCRIYWVYCQTWAEKELISPKTYQINLLPYMTEFYTKIIICWEWMGI